MTAACMRQCHSNKNRVSENLQKSDQIRTTCCDAARLFLSIKSISRQAFYLIPPCVWRRSVTTLPAQNTDSHLCFLSLTSFVRRNRDWYKYGIWHIIMVALMMFRWLAHYLLRFSTEHSKDLWQTFCFKILLELFTKCSPNCQCGIIQSQTEGKTTPVSDLRSSLITVNNELMTDTTGDLYWLTF